jgi:hypothetical protein
MEPDAGWNWIDAIRDASIILQHEWMHGALAHRSHDAREDSI